MSRWAASMYSPSAIARWAASMNRSTRSSAGSGLEKSTKRRLPARPRRPRPDPVAESHSRPLQDLLAVGIRIAGEVDPRDGAHAPLGIGDAAGVAVDDRMVGHPACERIALRPVPP